MALFYRYLQRLLLSWLAIAITGCSSPLDMPRQAALEQRAHEAAAADMPLQVKPDLAVPAFLEVDRQGQDSQRVRQPACGGYCLRLLYSGEVKTVISGFAVPAPPLDCAPILQARKDFRAGKIKTLDFSKDEWKYDDECEQMDTFMSKVTDADPPIIWRGASNTSPPYMVWARAYHIEKRKSCPGTLHTDTLRYDASREGKDNDADSAADQNIAAGQCLIAVPVTLDAASAIFLFTHEDESNYDKKSPLRDTRFSSDHLTVYGASSGGWPIIYRHTISRYSYLPVLAPGESYDSASFYVDKSSETKTLFDHVRSDMGLKLADATVAQVEYSEAVANALNNRDLNFISPNWNIVRDYMAAQKAKGPNKLEAQDARLIARLIADRRVTIQLRDLEDIVKANPQVGPILAAPLISALNTSPYEVMSNGYARELGNAEERRMIGEAGASHDDLLNAGSIRLDYIENGLAALNDESLRTQLPLYRQLVGNPYRRQLYPRIVEHMNLLPAAEALPTLRALITPGPVAKMDRYFQDHKRLLALRATCRMGDDAAPLLPDVIAFLKNTPEPESDGENAASAEIAWAILAHFHQADTLSDQLRPGKPYKALMAANGLNCHGWLSPQPNADLS